MRYSVEKRSSRVWRADCQDGIKATKSAGKRFSQILQYFRFYDCNADNSPHDKLRKVRPGLKLLIDKAKKIYHADEKVSLDEYLMLYKGRLQLKQFIKSKRARFGVKVFSYISNNLSLFMNISSNEGDIRTANFSEVENATRVKNEIDVKNIHTKEKGVVR